MLNITILGSCVTRDALEFLDEITIDNYLSRTSLISMMSQKSETSITIDKDLNGFLYRTLDQDINKTHFQSLENSKSDFIIIDFIDERFPLLKNDDSHYVTFSNYMQSHTNAPLFYKEKVAKLTMQNLSLWIQSAKLFSKKLKTIFKEEQIIIHEAYWAGNDINAQRNNTYLSIYYNFLKILLPNAHVIKIDEWSCIMNIDHKWGIAPYHYIDKYYQTFVSRLSEISQKDIQLKKDFSLNKETH